MNFIINTLPTWDTKTNIKNCLHTTHEINFWLRNIKTLNTRNMVVEEGVYDYVVHSDASNSALGIIVNEIKCHRNLNEIEKKESSTYRELIAVLHGLKNLQNIFRHKRVLWNVDNFAASCILRKGSSKKHLQDVAIELHEICLNRNINLNIKWIPREFNCSADLLSKYIDVDNWKITKGAFEYLDKVWGPFTIDRFANSQNSKLVRFNSKFFELGSEGMDAFQSDWGGEMNYLVPPVTLISKTIRKCITDKTQGVLIAPLWKSADYWPLLKNGSEWQEFILETKIFSFKKVVKELGLVDISWKKLAGSKTKIIALRLDCRVGV